jgi:peptide/nickel transport system permease protein
MTMRSYVAKRFLQTIFVVYVVATLMFILFRIMPSDPTATTLSPALNPESRAVMAEQYGLNQPLEVQYVKYLQNVVTFNFGYSFFQNRPVQEIISSRVLNTFVLMMPAVLFAFSGGTLLGSLAAWRRDTTFEKSALVTTIIARSIPTFLLGLALLYIFAAVLGWFPFGHMVSTGSSYSSQLDMYLSADFLWHLVLPLLSMLPFMIAFPMLLMRTSMLEIEGEDFILMCHAKGVKSRDVFLKHAVRNSILPVVTALPVSIGYAVTGNILIETIYSWPGIGQTLVQAVLKGDYPLAQAAFLLIAIIVIVGNFLVDILYTWLDPRITYE